VQSDDRGFSEILFSALLGLRLLVIVGLLFWCVLPALVLGLCSLLLKIISDLECQALSFQISVEGETPKERIFAKDCLKVSATTPVVRRLLLELAVVGPFLTVFYGGILVTQ
jgi:hypothetical protein